MQEFTNLRVCANAVVDLIQEVPKKKWKVTVTGAAPYDTVRVYNLEKPTDDSAAQEGLRLFVLDVQKAHTIDVKGT